jgi:hypothetical protein
MTAVPIGDTVDCTARITPFAGDCDTSNNTKTTVDTVRAGCDPNEMWVSPSYCFPQTAGTTNLQYTLSFVNTGNAPAVNIYILDTLSPNVDISTLRVLMASNTMNISFQRDAAGDNIVKFDFPAINLPDSSHHDSCSGAVIFSIDTKPALSLHSTINNEAGIYFDVNAVVMTNRVVNLVGCPSEVSTLTNENGLSISPNPATGLCRIDAHESGYTQCVVTDILGAVVMEKDLTGGATVLDITTLAPGVYIVAAHGSQATRVARMVKM